MGDFSANEFLTKEANQERSANSNCVSYRHRQQGRKNEVQTVIVYRTDTVNKAA
jgi:hypothetical protein